MKFCWAAAIAFALAGAGHVDDKLAADAEADAAAAKEADCWCKGLEESLASRAREGDSSIQHLSSQKEISEISNSRLRMEIAGHQAEASEHQGSLDTNSALMRKAQAAYEDEQTDHASAVDAIGRALDEIPEGSGAHIRAALRGLNQTFTRNMQEARERHEGETQGLRESKEQMLRLANEAAATKQKRLAEGEATAQQAGAQLARYSAQRDADLELNTAVSSACASLERGAAERLRLRQQVSLAMSVAKADAAQAASQQAASTVLLSKRKLVKAHGSYSPLEEATKVAAELSGLIAEADKVQNSLQQMLSSTVLTVHLAGSEHPADVLAALSALGAEAEGEVQSLPPLFEGVRAAGHKCATADTALVEELRSSGGA